MKFSMLAFLATIVGAVCVRAQITPPPPYQGVFVMSNEANNEIGVYRIQDDGSLVWVDAWETGGIGLPQQINTGQIGYTSANPVSYHIWADTQWIAGANMGGPDLLSSLSLFKVAPDLKLTRTDVINVTRSDTDSYWANSVTGYRDRICVLGGGTGVLVECYRISAEGTFSDIEFSFDLGIELTLDITEAGHGGTASIQFSPDGTKLAVLSKGSVTELFPLAPIPLDTDPQLVADGGLYVFPVLPASQGGYGIPSILPMSPFTRPQDLIWSPDSDRIWTDGLPTGLDLTFQTQGANVYAVDVAADTSLTQIGFYEFGRRGACWIEYLNGYVYTSNFVLNDDISIFPVNEDGSIDLSMATHHSVDQLNEDGTPATRPDGNDIRTAPLEFEIAGPTLSGHRYLYTQLHFTADIVSNKISPEDGSLTEVGRYPVNGNGERWQWFSSTTTTKASQAELNALFEVVPPGEVLFANDLVTGTYEQICTLSVAGAGSMSLNVEMSADGCQTRSIVHYAEPPEENCTGTPIIKHDSDRLIYYQPGPQPWNATAIAIRDLYTPLTEEGVAVMNATCPVADWQVEVGIDAFFAGCNLAQLSFNYFPDDCRTFFIVATFDENEQLGFLSGTGTDRCYLDTRTSVEEDLTPTLLQWISSETTDPRTCGTATTPMPTPAPVTLVPDTPAPVTPVPDTPAPVAPVPVTPAPVAPVPVTPAPVAPTPRPPTSSASAMSTFGALAAALMVLLL